MRASQFITEDTGESKKRFIEMFSKFLPVAMHYLQLKSLPKIIFKTKIEDVDQPTFGRYVNGQNTLYVALVNRHPNDILRTVAHELQHYKQDTEHKLHVNSGETGSPEENEAHAMAGIVMRHFNKQYPEYIRSKPVMEKWSEKYKRSINCSNPKGFSQRAHCQGRKKNEDIAEGSSDDTGDWEEKLMGVWAPFAAKYMARVVKQSFNSLYPDVKLKVWAEDEGVTATTDLASANVKADVFGQYGKKDWECNFLCGPLFYSTDGRKYLELMIEDAASGSYPGVWRIILSEWKKWASSQLKKTGADDVCFSVDEDMSGGAWEKVAGAVGIK
ncbi:MAG: hypothetical protein EB069_10960, partial [Actinobacteria bacterium]|nr:hypothetical protein [Actinomycetota bacterium]